MRIIYLKSLSIAIVSLIAIIALVGLIIFILVEAGDKSNSVGECPATHESYDLLSESKLGNYSQFAVAVDNSECSTVGRFS